MSSTGQVVGYMRVSAADQNLARQEAALSEVEGVVRVFQDKQSGKDVFRPGLEEALRYVREGDTLVVASMDRLSRSLSDLCSLVDGLVARGVAVRFLKEGLVFGAGGQAEALSRLMLGVLGGVAEFERASIRERQAEGIKAAKAKGGKYMGRKAVSSEKIEEARALVEAGVTVAEAARRTGVARKTLYRHGVAGNSPVVRQGDAKAVVAA